MMKLCNYARLLIVLAVMGLAAQVRAAQVYLDPASYGGSIYSWQIHVWGGPSGDAYMDGITLSNGLIEYTINDGDNNLQFVRRGNLTTRYSVDLTQVKDATYTITSDAILSSDKFSVDVTAPVNFNAFYLDPSVVTDPDDVWYVWAWTTGGNGSWYAPTQSDDVIGFRVPDFKDNIIFVRMDPNGAPTWNGSVQTNDLSLLGHVGGTYVITSEGNTNTHMTGEWRTPESTDKPVWQQISSQGANYLSNRRALVGRHCMVNKLVNVVGVGSWINDLNNLVDEDLDNYATFPKIADVGVGVNPVTSVRDTKNHYAAGTTAGFSMVMASDASLLGVDVANCFAISFFLEGKLQTTVAVGNGQSFGGVGLSLITLPGSTDVCVEVAAQAPCEFDEIALMPAGVQVAVASNARLRYAFVGDLVQHTITETSMQDYAADHDRMEFSLDQGARQREGRTDGIEVGYWVGDDLINDDLTDGVAWGVISIGSQMEARVGAAMDRQDPDQSQPFKAGSTVGFAYGNGSILNLPLGDAIRVRLYEGHWVDMGGYYEYQQTEVQDESVKINVLSVNLVKGGNYEVTITADHDFSHARISFPTGLDLNVGGVKVKYAYVCDPPEAYHKCNLDVSANVALCASDTQYQLTANGGIPVTWSIVSQPSGANATIDENGLLTGITVEDIDNPYIVRATAADGCYEDIYVTSGLDIETRCDMPISNNDETVYALSTQLPGADGALITINDKLIDKENVLNADYNDYATYNSVINAAVIDNLPIVGVKKLNGNFSNGTKRRVGFVVETKSTGLSADALNIFNLRCYKNGVRTYWHAIDETNVVKAKVIASGKVQKLRYSITVPADVEFDEFALWISGVLSLDLEKFKIYYAFDEDAEGVNANTDCGDPLGCAGRMISQDYDGATLNSNEIQFAGAINAANVVDNLSYLVDDDINSAVTVTNTVSAGNGIVFAVDLGRVYSPKHQIGIVLDNKTYLANAKVGNWLTIKTYLNGVRMDSISDWSVIGVNAIGYGDKSFLYLNPTQPYDEVRITVAAIVNALDFDTKYFGIFVRSDYDGDGTPDCLDDYTCPNPLGVDVRYESEFNVGDLRNIYKNHILIYNEPTNPVMIEQMPVGAVINVNRVDDNKTIATIEVTAVTQNQDGTYTLTYSNTPGESQDHVDNALYPASTGTFTADEWGYIDFLNLYVTDQFSKSTADNNQPTVHHYMAQLVNQQRAQQTESRILEVPVLKSDHMVNAATYTQQQVDDDLVHTLPLIPPVDVYIPMTNKSNIVKYDALRNLNGTNSNVAWAERDGSTNDFNLTSINPSGVEVNMGVETFLDNETKTVVLRDSTMQEGTAYYMPVISAYTGSYNNSGDTTVLSTYGANYMNDQLPQLGFEITYLEKSKPYNGMRSYTAKIKLTPHLPEGMRTYRYRIWRVMPNGTEVRLDTLPNESGGSGESAWYRDYSALKTTYPGNEPMEVCDIFYYTSVKEGETLNVDYIARLYGETDLPSWSKMSNRDGGKGYAPAPGGGSPGWSYDDNTTPTALFEINDMAVPVSTTYYNPLGMSSNVPFEGVNIVVTRYNDGNTMVQKRTF